MVMKEEPVTITTDLPARTSAYLVAEVRPQVNGVIQKRFFTEGDDVKAGDVLYQIDPAPYQAAYDNAKAALVIFEQIESPDAEKARQKLAEWQG